MVVTFDEAKHEYKVNGEQVPSVSEIIAPITEQSFATINKDVLAAAAARGTLVHSICESIDLGYDDIEDVITPEVDGMVHAYTEFLDRFPEWPKWDGIEYMVPCLDIYPIPYCGTIDRWLYDGTTLYIVDLKTVQAPTIEQKIALCVQTRAYEMALRERHGISPDVPCMRLGVYLKKTGKHQILNCDEFEEKEGFHSSHLLYKLIRLYENKRGALEDVEKVKAKHRRRKKKDD